MFGAFMVLYLLAAFAKVPLGKSSPIRPIPATSRARIGTFLFLFQMLKFFERAAGATGHYGAARTCCRATVPDALYRPWPDGQACGSAELGVRRFFCLGAIAWGGLTAAAIANYA